MGTVSTSLNIQTEGVYTVELNISPDGATATPVNDIQTWLHCANIWDKSYTTLDEVLADTTTLLALISSNNAVDYMARSTDWASDESKGLIPTMTSHTAPSGTVSQSAQLSNAYYGWYAFNPTYYNTGWYGNATAETNWLQYAFDEPVAVGKLWYRKTTNQNWYPTSSTFIVQGSNTDGSGYVDLGTLVTNTGSAAITELTINNTTKYKYYRLYISGSFESVGRPEVGGLQFYEPVGIVNNQTAMGYIGNNDYCAEKLLADSTWREAICNSTYFESVLNIKIPTGGSGGISSGANSSYPLANAFDNNPSTWVLLLDNSPKYIGYNFNNNLKLYLVSVTNRPTNAYAITSFKVQDYDGANWEDLSDVLTNPSTPATTTKFPIENSSSSTQYRLLILSSTDSAQSQIAELQFYGRA